MKKLTQTEIINITFGILHSEALSSIEKRFGHFKHGIVAIIISLASLDVLASEAIYTISDTIQEPSITLNDRFGYSVAIDDDYLLVGARTDETLGIDVGQAHLFRVSTGELVQTFNDPTPTDYDFFGSAVAIHDNYAVIGAPGDSSNGAGTGQVYVYNALTGQLVHTLVAPGIGSGDMFGASVTIEGDNILIGAIKDDSNGTNVGKAYLYSAITGLLINDFSDPTVTNSDNFGYAVALSGDKAFIGSPFDDTIGKNVGQVYLFSISTGALIRIFNDPTPTNTDRFGTSIAADGDRLLVGADGDDSIDSGVGQAYLFSINSGLLLQVYNDPNPTHSDRFGTSVAINGEHVLIGASTDDTYGANVGQAHIFDTSTGQILQTLNDPTVSRFDNFGSSLAMKNGTIAIGAYNDDTDGFSVGQVHIFSATETCSVDPDALYSENSIFNDPTITRADRFGYSVSMDGDYLLIGSRTDETLANDVGQAHLFRISTGELLYTFDDPTPTGEDFFGHSVSISGGYVVIGAPGDNSIMQDAGEAHIYNALTGELLHTITAPLVNSGDMFGASVAVEGEKILIGASKDDSNGNNVGKAFIFNANTGLLERELTDPTATNSDQFGTSVAISGVYAFVGALFDDTFGHNVGQVYMFSINTGMLIRTFDDPTPTDTDRFGISISVDDNKLIVGASGDDSMNPGGGQAYLFSITTGQVLQIYDDPTPTYFDRFGTSVAIDGDDVLVGDRTDDTFGTNVGQAHIFSALSGQYLQTLNDPTVSRYDNFGFSVAIENGMISIGAHNDDTEGFSVGQAHLFTKGSNCF